MKTFEHIRKLQENGVAFESYTEEHFRTTAKSGELMIALAAWIADQQRERLVEQTKAGLARARAQGKQLGRRPNATAAKVKASSPTSRTSTPHGLYFTVAEYQLTCGCSTSIELPQRAQS
jgi:DNA invertase Pin-like site-specific DNA recombinase